MKDMSIDKKEEAKESESQVQAIIKTAGARPKPDPFRKNADKTKLKETWRAEVAKNRRSRLWKTSVPLGIAAALVLAILIGVPQFGTLDESLGEVLLTQGEVSHRSVDTIAASNQLAAGDIIASQADSTATLRLRDHTVVQLAPSTQLTMRGPSDIWLHKGKIFVDSPGFDSRVTVRSSWGEIRDIGTQFEVSLSDDSLELAMREGTAEIALENYPSGPIIANSSEREADLVLVESGNKVSRTKLKRNAQRWNWIRFGAPEFPAGDHSLASIVNWAARQTGREVSYDSPLAVLQLKNERVVWPPLQLQTLEPQLTELSETSGFRIAFTETDIEVSIRR